MMPAAHALALFVASLLADAPDAKPAREGRPFAVVFIDEKTEEALGKFPYDRAVYAQAIDRAAEAGARGVILKVFIDQPKREAGDRALAESLTRTKVVLQARLDDVEPDPNLLPERFVLEDLEGDESAALSGESGWLPLPALSEHAHDVGFIDSTSLDRVPVVERYRGRFVKSLYTCALELALGEKAELRPGESFKLGDAELPLDGSSQAAVEFPEEDDIEFVSFVDLIEGKVPAEALADRVVILGYDGKEMPTNPTPIGDVKGHRVFCYQLFSLYDQLRAGAARR